uniref:dihydroxy-acid dehydratase n=1 Tax=uncultured Lentibacter sp. TaxID=1659309 RepID=UPI002604C9FF
HTCLAHLYRLFATNCIHQKHQADLAGGNIGKIETGDIVRVDPEAETVNVVSDPNWLQRPLAEAPTFKNLDTLGMNMFAPMRAQADNSEAGASVLGNPAWMD